MNANANLFRLAVRTYAKIKEHAYAAAANSSQALCRSAFDSLDHPEFAACRDAIVSRFVGRAFPRMETKGRPRTWGVSVEVEDRTLLSEYGPTQQQSTSIDALLQSSREVVAVECKFDRDARDGFGGCSQYHGKDRRKCAGFYGPGSDQRDHTAAWCRLETWDGERSPRHYWALARTYFRPDIFNLQTNGGAKCPLRDSHYQLMRNFLFAAAKAERDGRTDFGLIACCSERCDGVVRNQLDSFRDEILSASYRNHVALVHYETLVAILREQGDGTAAELADFLDSRITQVLGA